MNNFFEEILISAEKYKHKKAIYIGNKSYTYTNLIQSAYKLSHVFEKTQDKNSFCIIISNKTINFYQAMLACFFSNSVYIPLNVMSGIEKSKMVLSTLDSYFIFVGDIDSEIAFDLLSTVSDKNILFLFKTKDMKLKSIIENNHCYYVEDYPLREINFNSCFRHVVKFPDARNYAYLFFTSGSTGKPKAVPISYLNLSTYIDNVLSLFSFSSKDRFIQLSDIAFDISIHEILLCLVSGATLYVYDDKKELGVSKFIASNKISHCILVPSAMPVMIAQCRYYAYNFQALKNTFICGEPFPVSFAKEWETVAPNSKIVNLYGPTEATVSCTYHVYDKDHDYAPMLTLPIGRPFLSTQLSMTKRGELVISGQQVSEGYWPFHTVDKFRYDLFSESREYFSGDHVSYDEQYGYLFHGRFDDQWQLKGCRIEKAEVESALRHILHLHDICVVPRYDQNQLIFALVAFSTFEINDRNIKKKLQSYCPNFCLPILFVKLNKIPVLPNGKTNYNILKENING
ncbi:MAG: AMP-binding protein [Gammaproteobacteria bacterium]|nr:AMP-binding protein [Gammaproteobacteria bacterium]